MMAKRPNRRAFLLMVLVQVLFLIGMIAGKVYTLETGTKILLRTIPVDPRDLFRGDYVRLAYEISNPPPGPGVERLKKGQVVWVVLGPRGKHWEAVSVHPERPAVELSQLLIKGRAAYDWKSGQPVWDGRRPELNHPRVNYGLEEYYVPEGHGRRIEERGGLFGPPPEPERRRTRVEVEVSVDRFGSAALKRIFLEGEEIKFD